MRALVLGIAFATTVALAPAAPVPRAEAQKELLAQLWGATEGQGEFELNGKELTIRAACAPDGEAAMPRVARKVKGDFVATVRVLDAVGPNPANPRGDRHGTRAGLHVRGGDVSVSHCLFQYFPMRIDGGFSDTVNRQHWSHLYHRMGSEGHGSDCLADGDASVLKITRRGNVFTFSSSNGTKWTEPHTPQGRPAVPDELTVGVAVMPLSSRAVHATFADLTIEPLKPEPKK